MFYKFFNLNNHKKIPIIGFGTSHVNTNESGQKIIIEAIKQGYLLIDTAELYKTQTVVGKAVNQCIKDGIVKRDDIFIQTKVWNSNQGYDNTIRAFNKSLNELNLDYVDLYLIHWAIPNGHLNDYKQLNIDTWRAMEDLYKQGKIKSLGLSNFNCEQIDNILHNCKIKPSVLQIEMHPGCYDDQLINYCKKHNIRLQSWGPIIHGRANDEEALQIIANKHHATPSQICLSWSLFKGSIPLPRTMNKDHLIENYNAIYVHLNQDDVDYIDSKIKNNRYGSDPSLPYPISDEEMNKRY